MEHPVETIDNPKSTYLIVIDGSKESQLALRYAARLAARTQSAIRIVVILPPQEFLPMGTAQATLEAEARDHAESLAAAATRMAIAEAAIEPQIGIHSGEPKKILRELMIQSNGVAALILGAAESGPPGPLVTHFAGNDCGKLPCPVVIVPGRLNPAEFGKMGALVD